MNRSAIAILGLTVFVHVGCATRSHVGEAPPTTQTATDVNPEFSEPSFWLGKDAVASAQAGDFDTLWNAADRVSRDLLFRIDRQDRRGGVLTTVPTVSAQFFEPWRQELQSGDDLAKSSVATIRRTIYFTFEKTGDGYSVTPKVLVEREAIAERRVSGYLGRGYFRRDPTNATYGTRETDAGQNLAGGYWYATGRDEALEKVVADRISSVVK